MEYIRTLFLLVIIPFYVISPKPANAQDIKFSAELTSACLEHSRGNDRSTCIGLSASKCQTATGAGGSTAGMGACLGQELDWWDAKLNKIYRQWVAREKAEDAQAKEGGWNAPEKLPELKNMQRAWIQYRDALCGHEVVQWGGGTGGGPAYLACELRETARQYLVLVDRLDDYSRN